MPIQLPISPDVLSRPSFPSNPPDLVGSFFSGSDQAQKQKLQNLFADGVPMTPDGQFNYKEIARKLLEASGAPAVATLPGLRQGDLQQDFLNQMRGQGQNIFGAPTVPQVGPQSAAPASPVAYSVGQRTGETLRPDQPGNTVGANEVGPAMMSVDGGPQTPIPTTSFAPEKPAVPTGYPQQFGATPNTGPPIGQFTPDQRSEAAPPSLQRQTLAQVSPEARGAMAQAPAQAPAQATPPPPPEASPITDQNSPGYWTLENAKNLSAAAARANYFATGAGVVGFRAEGLLQQGKMFDEQAKQIRDAIAKREELTPKEKEYRAGRQPGETLPQYEARTAGLTTAANEDVKDFQKQAGAITTLANNATVGLQKAALAKSLTLDPNFYSGPFATNIQAFRQFQSTFGKDPTVAMPMEAFNKEANDLLQEQIKAMAQSGVGRVLMSEVMIMQRAVANLGLSPQSNRALLEISSRVYRHQQELASIAENIDAPPGKRAMALSAATRKYQQDHPLFTEDELRNPEMLGAPDVPKAIAGNAAAIRQWGVQHGVQPGQAIRFPSGAYREFQ